MAGQQGKTGRRGQGDLPTPSTPVYWAWVKQMRASVLADPKLDGRGGAIANMLDTLDALERAEQLEVAMASPGARRRERIRVALEDRTLIGGIVAEGVRDEALARGLDANDFTTLRMVAESAPVYAVSVDEDIATADEAELDETLELAEPDEED